ncbi:YggS family pyridoxal phosphate-dependent enzyme [Psychromicrobium lacuslunae]|uniref:Pyridoxal phosphate homeostasis protein n=1 Tax=Psychromicrobium lacuslunae TaxID=1618207 RepID=A0A0D4BX82_9MICC|nr:YggS family pyridoxal phosphate-dependent enzyme [Psychromicrobium lacuslunae]AJT40721.1 alanine racemase [Psychromicrobium lacuslunae]
MQQSVERKQQLAQRLQAVRQRIDRAVQHAGRSDRPELIVVTKFHPAADVLLLAELGVEQVGENRDQEAAAKQAELAAQGVHLRWHFIGQLQSNKAKSVAHYAEAVHSVDRQSLVDALGRAVASLERPALKCFVQIDLAAESTGQRGGASPSQMLGLADQIASTAGLELAGLMAVAPLGEQGSSADPDAAFRRLAELSQELREIYPQAQAISAGMSSDLEVAVAHGATHLRIGSDVLGARPAVR